MLWTIFVILLVLWLLGLVSSYTMGGFIHLLLVVALILLVLQLITGRRTLAWDMKEKVSNEVATSQSLAERRTNGRQRWWWKQRGHSRDLRHLSDCRDRGSSVYF